MATVENIESLDQSFLTYTLNWPVLTEDTCAFGGQTGRKAEALALAQAHQDFDAVVQGQYWEHGSAWTFGKSGGCSVGCLTHATNAHGDFVPLYGIPASVAKLSDDIFESLIREESKSFPVRFISAIPVGADLTGVYTKLRLHILERWYERNPEQEGVYRLLVKDIPGWNASNADTSTHWMNYSHLSGAVNDLIAELRFDLVSANYDAPGDYVNLSEPFLKFISECVPA